MHSDHQVASDPALDPAHDLRGVLNTQMGPVRARRDDIKMATGNRGVNDPLNARAEQLRMALEEPAKVTTPSGTRFCCVALVRAPVGRAAPWSGTRIETSLRNSPRFTRTFAANTYTLRDQGLFPLTPWATSEEELLAFEP